MNTPISSGVPAGSHGVGPGETPHAPPVSIAEMIERHVAFTWPEAIALVAEVCRLVVEGVPTATHVPEPSRLLVFGDGSIRIGPWRGEMDLSTLARTLHDLLASAQPPTPLRLFVGHAISSDKFAAVSEFADALAYYERPGRTELIQSAFQRFLSTPADMPAPVPTPVIEPVVPPRNDAASVRKQKRMARMLAAAVFLLVFAGGVTFALRVLLASSPSGGTPTLESVSAKATTELAQLKNTLRSMGLPISADPAPTPPVAPEPSPTTAGVRPRSSAPRRPVGQGVAASPDRVAVAAAQVIEPGPSLAEVSAERAASMPLASPAIPASTADDEIVYSNESPGVSPPVVANAHVMPSNLQVSGTQAQNRMELIIGPDGRVEQVRLLSQLQRMPDMMLLSGAKSWLFRPAMKDGRPVRYRLPLTWAVSPR